MAHHADDEHPQDAAAAAEPSVAWTFFIGIFIALSCAVAGAPSAEEGLASLAAVSTPTVSSPPLDSRFRHPERTFVP